MRACVGAVAFSLGSAIRMDNQLQRAIVLRLGKVSSVRGMNMPPKKQDFGECWRNLSIPKAHIAASALRRCSIPRP